MVLKPHKVEEDNDKIQKKNSFKEIIKISDQIFQETTENPRNLLTGAEKKLAQFGEANSKGDEVKEKENPIYNSNIESTKDNNNQKLAKVNDEETKNEEDKMKEKERNKEEEYLKEKESVKNKSSEKITTLENQIKSSGGKFYRIRNLKVNKFKCFCRPKQTSSKNA